MKIYNLKFKNKLKKVNRYRDLIIIAILILTITILSILGYKFILEFIRRFTIGLLKFFFIVINGEC